MFKKLLDFFKFKKPNNQFEQLNEEEEPIVLIRSNNVWFSCLNSDDLFCFTNIARAMSYKKPKYFLLAKSKVGEIYKLKRTTYIDAHYAIENKIREEYSEQESEENTEKQEEQQSNELDETTKILKQKIAEKQAKEKSAKENK